jgi:transcriptional regulator with XRE-family HTH domain
MKYRLKQARKMKGLTLREAAKQLFDSCGWTLSHEGLRKYENGEVKMDSEKLIKFANFYKVSVDYLIESPHRPKVTLGKIRFFKQSKY